MYKNISAIGIGYGKFRIEPTKIFLIFIKKDSRYTAVLQYIGSFATFKVTHFRLVEATRIQLKVRNCKVYQW